jgi:hypothetical protein
MERPAPSPLPASCVNRALAVARRHVLLFWIAAALALVGFGLLPRELRQELQRYRVVKLAPEFSAQGQGFSLGLAPLFNVEDREFSTLRWLWSGKAAFGAPCQTITPLFPLQSTLYFFYAGFPDKPGANAWLVTENHAGEQTRHRLDLENVDRNQTLKRLHIPSTKGAVGFRLEAAVEDPKYFFSFTEPFLLELSWPGQCASLAAQALTFICAAALTLLPGLALRRAYPGLSFAFLPIPGTLLLALIGLAIWLRPESLSPNTVASAFTYPVLIGLFCVFRSSPLAKLTTPSERRALVIALLMAGLAVAKAGYSLGPAGDLYPNRISRTLEVGDRADSRISYHNAQLAFHRQAPYSERAQLYFSPWNFSSRGPFPGLAAATIMSLTDAKPSQGLPDNEWRPFDEQGFTAYRIAMIVMAAMSLVMFFGAIRLTLSERWALFTTAVAAITPFLIHETFFTWPKLQAAGYACAAAWLLARSHPLTSGLCLGLGYLIHPLILMSGPAFACLAVFSVHDPRRSFAADCREYVRAWLMIGLGLGVCILFWRFLNWPHFGQGIFLSYLSGSEKGLGWMGTRMRSIANTLIPLRLYLLDSGNPAVNAMNGVSPDVIHFFFQYWNTAPFGYGLVAGPALLYGLYHAARRQLWSFLAFAALPLFFFALFWGYNSTGMLREGLHVWVLSVIYLFALGLQSAVGQDAAPPRWVLNLLWLRVVEILAMLVLPAALTQGEWLRFPLNDAVMLAVMLGATLLLGRELRRAGASITK